MADLRGESSGWRGVGGLRGRHRPGLTLPGVDEGFFLEMNYTFTVDQREYGTGVTDPVEGREARLQCVQTPHLCLWRPAGSTEVDDVSDQAEGRVRL